MSKIGIVILNYNDYNTTCEMLEQIKNYRVLNHIIVVDNNSTDGKFNDLKKYENDKIKIIKNNENGGYSKGNNYALKYLDKNYDVDYIIISNPDIVVSEDAIKKLKKDLDDNNNISLIAPVIKQGHDISRGWRFPTYTDELLSNINYVHKFAENRMKYDEKLYRKKLTKVDVVSGCFFMIRKDVFKKIGYFDEGTFLYYEENILAKKLKGINKNIYVDNKVSIIHNYSVSVDKNISSIKKYKILKQSQKYYEKKYNNLGIFKMALLRFLYYVSLIISYIIYFVLKIFK